MINMIKDLKEKITLPILVAVGLILAIICTAIIVFVSVNKSSDSELILSYKNNDQIIEIKEGETITLTCGNEVSVSVNNFSALDYPKLNWSYEMVTSNTTDSSNSEDSVTKNTVSQDISSLSSFELTEKGGRCYFSDTNPEKVKITVSGEKIVQKIFYIEFVIEQKEMEIKNTFWTAGDINYYLNNDGSIYIIYQFENNYIKGKYNYVKIDENEIDPGVMKEFKSLISDGILYQVDIDVSEEYLADKIYNNDSYVLYMYGNDEERAIYDGGWGFTKIAESIKECDEQEIDEIFNTASEKANKKISKKKLGNVANTAWNVSGVNYYFYNDGIFESISLTNHDFIKGTYTCQEVEEDFIDEKIVNEFKELMLPKKYFYVTCNVEKEIYNCENVNVTSLEIIIAQNGIKFALYDSNWDMVFDAEQIDIEAKEDFDVIFQRNIIDITGKISENSYFCNDKEYTFTSDGSYQMIDENNDLYIKGSYIAVDVYEDLIDKELLNIIKNKEYYYIEIKLDKVWHEKKDSVEDKAPPVMFLIISRNENEIHLYDSYLGSYDYVSDVIIKQ